jgi:hypothetical protein
VSPGTVAVLTTARIPGYRNCAVTLEFDPDSPLEVWLDFGCGDDYERVRWVFARDLLIDGLRKPVGHGDVSVAPAGERVAVLLDNGEESTTFYLPRFSVQKFVAKTLRSVPRGREVGDFDQELAEWLDGAR